MLLLTRGLWRSQPPHCACDACPGPTLSPRPRRSSLWSAIPNHLLLPARRPAASAQPPPPPPTRAAAATYCAFASTYPRRRRHLLRLRLHLPAPPPPTHAAAARLHRHHHPPLPPAGLASHAGCSCPRASLQPPGTLESGHHLRHGFFSISPAMDSCGRPRARPAADLEHTCLLPPTRTKRRWRLSCCEPQPTADNPAEVLASTSRRRGLGVGCCEGRGRGQRCRKCFAL
jgi:hypothetical protein